MKPWLSNNFKRFIAIFIGLAALAGLYWYGGYSEDSHGFIVEKTSQAPSFYAYEVTTYASKNASENTTSEISTVATKEVVVQTEITTDEASKETTKEVTKEVTKEAITETTNPETEHVKTKHCTIIIECHTLLSHMDELNKSVASMVPSDGIILSETTFEFTDECSAFDVLKAVCESNNIAMEYSAVPAYNSYYVEGIAHLYEFDCGKLSGWMYGVNGRLAEYGANNYMINDGDNIFFSYTCDIGNDLR